VPRHGNSAVDRNKLKRRLREIVRTELLSDPMAVDIVIRARHEAYAAPFEALVTELKNVRTAL
jgi:ribonuclease P protein component